jgi:hypothetical protein
LAESQKEPENDNNLFKPALLTRTEIDWLSDNIRVSKSYQYWLRFNIKTLSDFEIPLLVKKGFISSNENTQAGSALDSNQGTAPLLSSSPSSSKGSLDMAGVVGQQLFSYFDFVDSL